MRRRMTIGLAVLVLSSCGGTATLEEQREELDAVSAVDPIRYRQALKELREAKESRYYLETEANTIELLMEELADYEYQRLCERWAEEPTLVTRAVADGLHLHEGNTFTALADWCQP